MSIISKVFDITVYIYKNLPHLYFIHFICSPLRKTWFTLFRSLMFPGGSPSTEITFAGNPYIILPRFRPILLTFHAAVFRASSFFTPQISVIRNISIRFLPIYFIIIFIEVKFNNQIKTITKGKHEPKAIKSMNTMRYKAPSDNMEQLTKKIQIDFISANVSNHGSGFPLMPGYMISWFAVFKTLLAWACENFAMERSLNPGIIPADTD